jgi:HEAT repeat protein
MNAQSFTLDEAIAASVQYVLDPPSRSVTRPALDQLRRSDPETLLGLVERMRGSTKPEERAVAALLAPGLGDGSGTDVLLAAIEEEKDPVVLVAATEALGELDGSASSNALTRLAGHSHPYVRRAVAVSLYGKQDSAARSTLLTLIEDQDADVRDWAAWALADTFEPDRERDIALTRWLSVARTDSQLAAQVRAALESPQGIAPRPRPRWRTKQVRGPRPARAITVLVASANPLDTDRLALDEEVKALTEGLRATPARDIVDLRTAWAVRPVDLLVELNEYQPEVLHFSGHGMADGRLVFLDAAGNAKPVDSAAVASTVATAGESVRVVVLNACFSSGLAQSLTKYVDVAVGMDRPVGDDAARVFSRAFYSALGYGLSVGRAFEQARTALMLEGFDEHDTPQLAAKDGVDPHDLVLVDRASALGADPDADRETLQRITAGHLSHLAKHALLPLGEGLEIGRSVGESLHRRAEGGSLFLVGPPGSGKSGALYRLARDLIDAGRDVVVLAADLLSASGRRSLQEELDLQLDLIDALAAWPGKDPGFLVIDALDAARGREAASVLLEVIERVAGKGGRWHIVASVRSFDLRHNPDLQSAIPARAQENGRAHTDPEFAFLRHVAVGGLSDEELTGLAKSAPPVHVFLSAASPELVELLRVPFNLSLLAGLLERDRIDLGRLHAIRTQLELLDLYWERRVLAPASGRDARELLATKVCDVAVETMRLQVPRAELRELAAIHTPGFEQLLGAGVLVETQAAGTREESVGFAHHVLFDYAIHRLILTGSPDQIAKRLAASDELVLLARPSLVYTLVASWEADERRRAFWGLALRLADEEVPMAARLVGPTVAVERASRLLDFEPLLAAVDRREAEAFFNLRHIVGARAASGSPSRPLEGADLGLWGQLAVSLSERISYEVAYPLRLLVWGLSAELDRLASSDMTALGVSARALLTWAWAQEPAPPQELALGLEAVARSCRSDPSASQALLSRAVDPERIPQYGYVELRPLANELPSLASCVPDFAAQLYEAAFGYDEESEETTPIGPGQILRLTSTRRQDWSMVQYALAQDFPVLLQRDARAAVRAVAAACIHEAQRYSSSERKEIARFNFLGGEAGVISDGSTYWNSPGSHQEVGSMLDAFEEQLASSATNGAEPAGSILRALGGDPQPAGIWRHVLGAAARAPATLAPHLADAAASGGVLLSNDLREPLCELLHVGPAYWDSDAKGRIEAAILGLPDRYPAERREAGERTRDRLLSCIPQEMLETAPAREIRAALEADRFAEPQPEPGDFAARWEAPDAEHEFRERGIDPTEANNRTLLDAIEPVSAFVSAHVNAAPSREEARDALGDVIRLQDAYANRQADPTLLEDAQAWLSEAAAALAWQTPLPVDDGSVVLARELALDGASGTRPSGKPESLEEFDRSGPAWGVPSGRIDAARALLRLGRDPQTADPEVMGAIELLAQDPHPAVRWVVARELGLARKTQPKTVWTLITRLTNDPSAQVLQALLHPLAQFSNERLDDLMAIVRNLYDKEMASRKNEALVRALTNFLIEFWIWRAHPAGRKLVDEWIEDIEHYAEAAQTTFYSLREPVTHGGDNAKDAGVRHRVISVWADLTRAAGDALATTETMLRTDQPLTPERREQIPAVTQLLNASATELFFGSGAYAEKQSNTEKQLTPAVRERFYREADPIIEVLVTVGVPAIAHHVLQTLATYIEIDPRGILVRVGKVLDAGREWGYQAEGLAEREFVQLVERYLASHRDLLLGDRESRRILLAAIEGFVEAGWPSARRLLYGLDDMFR